MTKRAKRIVQANAVTSASYRLTLVEKQILLLAIAKLGEMEEVTAETPFAVSAREMVEVFGLDERDAYRQLQDSVEHLAERWIVIDKPDPESPKTPYTKTRWVYQIVYLPGEGEMRFYFAPRVIPYLSGLSREFTQFSLANTAKMTSIYAVRIYELLSQWRSRGALDIELEWLREKFELPESYRDVRDLKKRVIQPAVDQINRHSDIWTKCAPRKQGRNIVAFAFLFGPKPLAPPPTKKPKLTDAYVGKHARPGESWDQARERLSRENKL